MARPYYYRKRRLSKKAKFRIRCGEIVIFLLALVKVFELFSGAYLLIATHHKVATKPLINQGVTYNRPFEL